MGTPRTSRVLCGREDAWQSAEPQTRWSPDLMISWTFRGLTSNMQPRAAVETTSTWNPVWTWELSRATDEQKRRADLVVYVAGQESECQYLMDRHGYSYKEALRATHAGAGSDRRDFKRRAEGAGYTFEGMRGEVHGLVRRHAYTIETNAKPLDRHGRRGGTWA